MTMTPPERAGRGGGQQPGQFERLRTQAGQSAAPEPRFEPDRTPAFFTIGRRTVTDVVSMALIVAGFTVGDVCAWRAGPTAGLAVLAVALIALGLLLA